MSLACTDHSVQAGFSFVISIEVDVAKTVSRGTQLLAPKSTSSKHKPGIQRPVKKPF